MHHVSSLRSPLPSSLSHPLSPILPLLPSLSYPLSPIILWDSLLWDDLQWVALPCGNFQWDNMSKASG